MQRVRRWWIVLPVLGLLAGLAAPALASAPTGHAAGLATTTLAPVYVHYKPSSVSVAPGTTVNLTAVVLDKGSSTYNATSCTSWYRIGTSGSWTKKGSCLNTTYLPHLFAAHSTSKFHGSVVVPAFSPAGTYQFKLQLGGTFGSHSAKSHPAIFTLTVT